MRTVAEVAAFSALAGAIWPALRPKYHANKSLLPLPATLFGRNTPRAKSPTFMFTAAHAAWLLTAVMNRSPCQTLNAACADDATHTSVNAPHKTSARFIANSLPINASRLRRSPHVQFTSGLSRPKRQVDLFLTV